MLERKIIQVLSHNVVMAKLPNGKNSILFGKGIGFQKKPGMLVDESCISREFLLHTSEVIEHFEQVLNAVDIKIIATVEEVIAFAQNRLEGEFSDRIHSALVDHINFAIERCNKGVLITNPFAFEIKHLYEKEYKVAEKAVAYISETLKVNLPEDEIAFLAMHFHSARKEEKGTRSLAEVRIVSQVIEEAKALGFDIGDSFSTIRFISHLKGLIERVQSGRTLHNPLLPKIMEEYQDVYRKASIIAIVLKDALKTEIKEDEIGYLTMHLERLQRRYR